MKRRVGTTVRGLRAPMVKEGDDIIQITVDSVLEASEYENVELRDNDVVAITESLVARAQGNYVSIDNIVKDLKDKFGDNDIAVLFPILSRNRFSTILKAILETKNQIHLFLNYPSDEVGNHLMDIDMMDDLKVDPYKDFLTEEKYRDLFGEKVEHPFTKIDYVEMYKSMGSNIKVYLTNDPKEALNFTDNILVANIHERFRTKKILKNAGANKVYGLDDISTESINGSGYNSEYGLLGSNKATEDTVKLFPRDCNDIVTRIQEELRKKTGKNVEVMVYGDGAFKDPVGKIWELADPVVSPGFTEGLRGTPNEIKIKYVVDNDLKHVEKGDIVKELKKKIEENKNIDTDELHNLGTTPRQITDLIGSLCDLTSGSGDKGTPIIWIQGYFDNLASE